MDAVCVFPHETRRNDDQSVALPRLGQVQSSRGFDGCKESFLVLFPRTFRALRVTFLIASDQLESHGLREPQFDAALHRHRGGTDPSLDSLIFPREPDDHRHAIRDQIRAVSHRFRRQFPRFIHNQQAQILDQLVDVSPHALGSARECRAGCDAKVSGMLMINSRVVRRGIVHQMSVRRLDPYQWIEGMGDVAVESILSTLDRTRRSFADARAVVHIGLQEDFAGHQTAQHVHHVAITYPLPYLVAVSPCVHVGGESLFHINILILIFCHLEQCEPGVFPPVWWGECARECTAVHRSQFFVVLLDVRLFHRVRRPQHRVLFPKSVLLYHSHAVSQDRSVRKISGLYNLIEHHLKQIILESLHREAADETFPRSVRRTHEHAWELLANSRADACDGEPCRECFLMRVHFFIIRLEAAFFEISPEREVPSDEALRERIRSLVHRCQPLLRTAGGRLYRAGFMLVL